MEEPEAQKDYHTDLLKVAARNSNTGVVETSTNHNEWVSQETIEQTHAPGYSFSGFSRRLLSICGILLVLSFSLYAMAEYFGEGLSRGGHVASSEIHEVVIANNVLQIPADTIRFPNQRRAGVQSRIDLYLHWPSLSGYSDDLKRVFSDVHNSAELLFLTIEPRNMSYDMSGRLEPIYSVFFDGIGVEEDFRLIRQPLSSAGGFVDEDLYFQPDNPYPFVTRCVREGSNGAMPYCIRDVHIGTDLMVTYRFHKTFLKDWRALDNAIRKYSASLMQNQRLASAN